MSAALRFVVGVLGAATGATLLGMGCSDDDDTPSPQSKPDASTGGNAGTGGLSGNGGSGGSSGVVASGGSAGADASDAAVGCGNRIVEPPEQCDDGNSSDDDACLASCKFACGDGVKNSVETLSLIHI